LDIRKWWQARQTRKLEKRVSRWRDADFQALKQYALRQQREKADQLASHETHVNELRTRITALEHENDRLSRELVLAKTEIDGLAGVIERDRKRVESETAIAVYRIEAATKGLMGSDG
jgi:predicted nuclease with TOPRIM domain